MALVGIVGAGENRSSLDSVQGEDCRSIAGFLGLRDPRRSVLVAGSLEEDHRGLSGHC